VYKRQSAKALIQLGFKSVIITIFFIICANRLDSTDLTCKGLNIIK